MFLYGLLLLGSFAYLAESTCCVSETLRCARLFRPISIKEFSETPSDLNRECRLQGKFFNCLRNIAPVCYSRGYHQNMPESFSKMKGTLMELCIEGSDLRESYLMEAFCINRQDVSYCSSEEYLGTDLEMVDSPEKRCLLSWRSRKCIATLLKEQCGDGARDLFIELKDALLNEDCLLPGEHDDEYSDYDYRSEKVIDPRRSGMLEVQTSESPEKHGYTLHDLLDESTKRVCSDGNMSETECEATAQDQEIVIAHETEPADMEAESPDFETELLEAIEPEALSEDTPEDSMNPEGF